MRGAGGAAEAPWYAAGVQLGKGRLGVVCGVLFLAAMGARIVLLRLMHFQPHLELAEMELIAKSLAQTGSFANPYYLPTGPTAHHAPLYPFLLSLIFRVWGYGTSAAMAMAAMGITFAAAQYALLPALAVEGGLPVEAGMLAGAIGVIPFRILKEVRWEASMSGLILVLCTWLAVRWLRTFRMTALTGILFGLAMIAMPTFLPVLLLLAGWAAWRGIRRHETHVLRAAAVLLACAAVGVSPWVARNYLRFHQFVFVRSNYPLEFSLSNHDGVYPLAADNYSIGYPNNFMTLRHPWSNANEARLVQTMGEIAYNHARLAESLQWCERHPAQFLKLTAERFRLFWFPSGEAQRVKGWLMDALTLAGLIGVVLLWKRSGVLAAPIAAILIGFPLPYYFVQIDTRYRYPLDWCLYLGAAYAGWQAARRWRREKADAARG